jgi:hypothetical protein
MSFKYLGVTISSTGHLATHQQAMFSKAKVSAYEVGKLLRRLDIVSLERLTSYLQSFVDSQFYGAELFPLHMSLQIDAARKKFVCTCFDLPSHTARNLTYALFPVMPALFMLIKRRAKFYKRAQVHDLECVREAFLFDMSHMYPHKLSWCFQLEQMFRAIGVDLNHDIAAFPRFLEEFDQIMTDPRQICFHCIRNSNEKTLSFFRLFPDVDAASSFRTFLSLRCAQEQNFLILFLTSGLRWRFFTHSHRGTTCPLCLAHYWSWEHFVSCPLCPVRTSVPEITAMVVLQSWGEIASHVRRVVQIWISCFDDSVLNVKASDIIHLFPD